MGVRSACSARLDVAIVQRAREEQRIILTFDLDFGEILALGKGDAPSVIIFRLSNETSAAVNGRLKIVLSERRLALE